MPDTSDPIYNRIVEHISSKSGESDPKKYKCGREIGKADCNKLFCKLEYYNEKTNKLVEVRKAIELCDGEYIGEDHKNNKWYRHFDTEMNMHYYYNQISGEARWICPKIETSSPSSPGSPSLSSGYTTSDSGSGSYSQEYFLTKTVQNPIHLNLKVNHLEAKVEVEFPNEKRLSLTRNRM